MIQRVAVYLVGDARGRHAYRVVINDTQVANVIGEGPPTNGTALPGLYTALVDALAYLVAFRLTTAHVRIHTHDLTLVRQMTGHWKARGVLAEPNEEAMSYLRHFEDIGFDWIGQPAPIQNADGQPARHQGDSTHGNGHKEQTEEEGERTGRRSALDQSGGRGAA